ncbi:MAG TPA: tripartite tricarboxylate transporter substrate binding protein [Quisquiliibacterium sp.]|nr:tripartite tricarboxylate transporter substrate binding protein [Quisquiliibacterium sp.]
MTSPSRPVRRLLLGLAAVAACTVAHAQAQPWPSRPVRIVVPYGPGSSPDVLARLLGERLGARLGQPVVVENRPGAGGNVGTGYVARAAADGYTFVISTNGPLVNNTVLYRALPYDPYKDLAPVMLVGGQANVCAVRSDAGIDTMKDLVAAMRRTPGGFNFSSIGVGSLSHLGVELLKVRTGTYAVHIPYPSSPAAVMAVLQGDVQFTCVPAVAVMPQVRAGRLKALAVSTAARSPQMPEVPTMKESGVPDVEAVAWMAMLAPAQTPADIVARMNRELTALLQMPEVRARLQSAYMDPIGGTPEQLAKFMQDELRTWTPIIRRSGAKVD